MPVKPLPLVVLLLFTNPFAGAAPAQEDAAAVFERAIAAQLEKGTKPPPVQGFGVALNLREFGENPHEIDATLLYRRDRGGLLRLVVDDPDRGVRVEKGFDGERYWLVEDGKRLIDLSSREYTRDRQAVDDALRLGEELLLLLDLGRFRASASDLVLLHEDADSVELGGKLELAGEEQRFALHLRKKDDLADRLTLLAPAPHTEEAKTSEATPTPETKPPAGDPSTDPRARNFILGWYKAFDGRQVPQVIREYQGPVDEERGPVRILEIHRLLWREAPALAAFAPHLDGQKGEGETDSVAPDSQRR